MVSIPNKSLGQHWLTDSASLEAVRDAADIVPTDVVLEIGPGLGNLTELLVLSAREIIAVEFDEQLANQLPQKITAPNLRVVHQDILKFDLSTLPKDYKVVANIPYYLTSNLLRVLSESSNPPATIVLLVQKEVAERVAAKPGSMSLLSVSVQFYYQAELGRLVPAHLFTPPPKVDSRIIKLIRHQKPLFGDVDTVHFFRLVKAGFANRRKTLLNSMSAGLNRDKTEVEKLLLGAGVDPKARPQTLTLDEWYNLSQVLGGLD